MDDDEYVTGNLTLHSLTGLRQIWINLHATPQYYPLVFTSFWLEYHLWGLNPAGYHVINVLLHALAAILLWRILRRLQLPGAWLAAGIFALHPLAVESVAWVTELKNVMSVIFYFAAALAYWHWQEPGNDVKKPVQNPRQWYFIALALFVAALFSKTAVCSLPAALLLVIWWKRGRVSSRDVWPLLPFFTVAVALGLTTSWVERNLVGAQGPEWVISFPERCLIAGRALWFYAGKLFWPAHLTFIYPRWHIDSGIWWQWAFPVAALAVVAGLWHLRPRIGRGPLVAVLFFCGTLFPVLGFSNVYFMRYSFVADHFQYLAEVGLIVLAVAGLAKMLRPIPSAAIVLPLGLAVLTWKQSHIYADQKTLWQDTLNKNPTCWLAHNNLGVALFKQGEITEAASQYQQAIQLNPSDAEAHINLGIALLNQGRTDDAISEYQVAIRLKPDDFRAHHNLGIALNKKGQINDAISQFMETVRLKPDMAEAHKSLGSALLNQGQLDAATSQFLETIRLDPNDAEAHYNLGTALDKKGQTDAAISEFQEAAQLNPNDAVTHYNLGNDLLNQGRIADAIKQFQEAVQYQPDYAEAYNNLGAIFNEQGQTDKAIGQFEKATYLKPNYPDAHYNLALILFNQGQMEDAIKQLQETIRLIPNFADAHNNLGVALAQQNQIDAAITQFQEAIRLKPDFASARDNLTRALQQKGGSNVNQPAP